MAGDAGRAALIAMNKIYTKPLKMGPQSDYGNNRWEVYSSKLKRTVMLYSNLEFNHWILVESNSEIETFCEQPLKIKIRIPCGLVTTVFDMWIKWKCGDEEFREIKYEEEVRKSDHNSRVSRQIQAQEKWCELNNKKHSVMTEKTINSNPIYMNNWKMILRYIGNSDRSEFQAQSEKIISLLVKKKSLTIEQIERELNIKDNLMFRTAVYELLYSQRLITSLHSKPLDKSSILELINA